MGRLSPAGESFLAPSESEFVDFWGKLVGSLTARAAQRELGVGEKAHLDVELLLDKPTAVGAMWIAMVAEEHAEIRWGARTRYVDAKVRDTVNLEPLTNPPFHEGTQWPAGRHSMAFEGRIPQGARGSWGGWSPTHFAKAHEAAGAGPITSMGFRWQARIKVRVGRRMRGLSSPDVVVRAPARRPTPQPAKASPKGGISARKKLELALHYSQASPGGRLLGGIKLSAPPDTKVRGVRVELVEDLYAVAKDGEGSSVTRRLSRTMARVSLEPPGPKPVRWSAEFALNVPNDSLSTEPGTMCSRTHHVMARADLALARDLKADLPVEILGPAFPSAR